MAETGIRRRGQQSQAGPSNEPRSPDEEERVHHTIIDAVGDTYCSFQQPRPST